MEEVLGKNIQIGKQWGRAQSLLSLEIRQEQLLLKLEEQVSHIAF